MSTVDDVELANVIAGISEGPIVAGAIAPELMRAINAKTRTVYLSKYTIDKQSYCHKEINFQIYTHLVQTTLKKGLVLFDRARHLVFAFKASDGVTLKLVVSATKSGSAIYIKSLHNIKPQELRRLRRKGQKNGRLLRDFKGN